MFKKAPLPILTACCFIVVLISSCRKDLRNQNVLKQNEIAVEMQNWLRTQRFDTLTRMAVNKSLNNINWEQAISLTGDSSIVYELVPIKPDTIAKFDDPQLTLSKYFVLTKVNGSITTNALVSVLGNKANIESFPASIVNFSHDKQESFTGTISLNSITGVFKESKTYEFGTMKRHSVLQAIGKSTNKTIQSTNGKVLHSCYNYYLVTFDQYGGTISEQYLFQVCDPNACNTTAIFGRKATLSLVLNCGSDGTASGGGPPSRIESDVNIEESENTNEPSNNPAKIMYDAVLHCSSDPNGGGAIVESVSNMLMWVVNGSSTTYLPDGTEDTWYTTFRSPPSYGHSAYGLPTIQLTWSATKITRHTINKPGQPTVSTVTQRVVSKTKTFNAY
ncbi:hypothetical protein [Mucilaginibacter sp. 22184]|uniref:hypothetical protein n=1 Tax=Mucilaginibacter sp. 22184 TaxID=3453887 RepID=UPI003F83849D